MLYWICPECGQECSPAVRECPTCTAPPASPSAASGSTAASGELLSLAQNFPPAPSPAVLASPAGSRKTALSTNGHETSGGGGIAVAEEEQAPPLSKNLATFDRVPFHPSGAVSIAPAQPAPTALAPQIPFPQIPSHSATGSSVAALEEQAPPFSKNLATLDRLSFQPSDAVHVVPVQPVSAAVTGRVPAPQIPLHSEPARSIVTLPPGRLVPGGEIRLEPASGEQRFATPETTEPLPSRRRSVAFVRTELPLAQSGGMTLGNLAPLPRLLPHSGTDAAGQAFAPAAYAPRAIASVSSSLEPAESLSALLWGLQTEAAEADRRGVQAIESSFAAQPATPLLAAPAEIVQAPAPPCEKWMGTAKPKFTPVEPESAGRAALIGPRAPTLAGPTLPPQLLNFGQQPAGIESRRKRFKTWPLVLVGALLLTFIALQYYPQGGGSRTLPAALPAPISKVFSAPHSRVAEEHPAARSVEVAGFRILTPPRRKPQVQFLVINHSASEITGLNIHIAVSSQDGASDAPLFSVSSIVPSLGPEQSKEIRVDVNSTLDPSDIPDWQRLRTQVLIGRE